MRFPRLYPILDLATAAARGVAPVAAAKAMFDGGATILQWRGKGALSSPLLDQCAEASAMARQYGARLVVNDRADLAMLVASGLHVGQRDLPPSAARYLLGPDALLGLSTHNAAQIEQAEQTGVAIDYLALGPMYPTRSKENPDPVVGLELLRRWRPLTPRPLVAIGGITRDNARETLEAGADSVAVISDLFPERSTPSDLRRRMEEWINAVN